MINLKSELRQCYGRIHDLVNCYGISMSQMTTDMFRLSKSQSETKLTIPSATFAAGTAYPSGF